MVVISLEAIFMVNCMHKHVVLSPILLKLRQTLNVFRFDIEASCNYQSLIGILFSIGELEFVLFWHEFSYSLEGVGS